jgi:hypothetical protein
MPPAGFEPTISAGDRPKTYALDRAAIGTENDIVSMNINFPLLEPHSERPLRLYCFTTAVPSLPYRKLTYVSE